jgi:SHS2 domain-containing protein
MASEHFYKTFEHTADMGLEVEAPDRAGVFTRSAMAMFDIMFGLGSIGTDRQRRLRVSADSLEELLVAWLNDLLYVYSVEGIVFSGFRDVDLSEKSFEALGLGETFDPRKHEPQLEIKAATYHQLSITRDDGSWKAMVIFDI